jgi:hypothetical protein
MFTRKFVKDLRPGDVFVEQRNNNFEYSLVYHTFNWTLQGFIHIKSFTVTKVFDRHWSHLEHQCLKENVLVNVL